MRALLYLPVLLCVAACGENQTHPDRAVYDAGPPAALPCVPNLDGQIDRSELGAAIGVPARYLVSPSGQERPVNLVGTTDADGHRVWDWSTDFASDQAATLTASAPGGKWYADHFPGAQFVSPFDPGDTVEAIYSEDDSAIYLLGLASTNPNPPEGQTLYAYDAPVPFLRFPIQPGKTWKSVGTTKNQMLRGIPYAGTDTYEVSVDAAGQMVLPDVTFTQAMRVRTKLTIEATVGVTTSQFQTSYFF